LYFFNSEMVLQILELIVKSSILSMKLCLSAYLTLLSDGEGYCDMREFGLNKIDFLREILDFKNGIPSEDTFERVFQLLNPKQIKEKFIELMRLIQKKQTRAIAIDGKVSHRSHSKENGPLHLLSAWCHENGLLLTKVMKS
jgi:hypothetical protein